MGNGVGGQIGDLLPSEASTLSFQLPRWANFYASTSLAPSLSRRGSAGAVSLIRRYVRVCIEGAASKSPIVFRKKEVRQSHCDDAVLINTWFDVVSDNNHALKGIFDMQEGAFFLLHLLGVGHLHC